MKTLLVLFSFLMSVSAFGLECEVLVITGEEFLEQKFEAPMASQGHGGPEQTVKGEVNEVTTMADGKWLGISWRKNGELIAESINLIRDMISQPRVLIVYNPKNVDEQVSINCAE